MIYCIVYKGNDFSFKSGAGCACFNENPKFCEKERGADDLLSLVCLLPFVCRADIGGLCRFPPLKFCKFKSSFAGFYDICAAAKVGGRYVQRAVGIGVCLFHYGAGCGVDSHGCARFEVFEAHAV